MEPYSGCRLSLCQGGRSDSWDPIPPRELESTSRPTILTGQRPVLQRLLPHPAPGSEALRAKGGQVGRPAAEDDPLSAPTLGPLSARYVFLWTYHIYFHGLYHLDFVPAGLSKWKYIGVSTYVCCFIGEGTLLRLV